MFLKTYSIQKESVQVFFYAYEYSVSGDQSFFVHRIAY